MSVVLTTALSLYPLFLTSAPAIEKHCLVSLSYALTSELIINSFLNITSTVVHKIHFKNWWDNGPRSHCLGVSGGCWIFSTLVLQSMHTRGKKSPLLLRTHCFSFSISPSISEISLLDVIIMDDSYLLSGLET